MYKGQNFSKALFEKDATSLTGAQKTALIGAWNIVKRDNNLHAREVFILFFERFPQYLKYFDFSDDEAIKLRDNRSLHAHALNVFNAIGTLIEFGLRDAKLFECSVTKLVRNHRKRNVTSNDVKNFAVVLVDYIGTALAKQKTKTLEEALSAFLTKLAEAFE